MSPRHMPQAAQLGFNSLMDEAETANTTHAGSSAVGPSATSGNVRVWAAVGG